MLRFWPLPPAISLPAGCGRGARFLAWSLLLGSSLLLNAWAQAAAGDRYSARQPVQEEALAEPEPPAALLKLPPGVKVLRDVAYGPDALQAMDIYLPPHADHAPMIMMVHGGAWRLGDKASRAVVENKVARWVPKGVIFISVNYRMLPTLYALKQADDVARAMAFAQAHARAWGGEPVQLILMGHSAGAHLVALLAASPQAAYKFGAKPWLGTVALDSAALDVVSIMERPHPRFYDKAFGSDAAHWRQASPFHVLTPGASPLLAVCSTLRLDHPCVQAKAYAAKAAAMGVRVSLLERAATHKEINDNLGLPGNYSDAVDAFLATLAPGVAGYFKAAGNAR